ncbi:MAG: ComF family protein [Lachnospiraceae bacterium]|nr:ComF family protein [Lachnospiraceae bacterium]
MKKNGFLKGVADLLFPVTCPVCGDVVVPKGRRICSDCKKMLPYLKGPACLKCGKPVAFPTDEYCDACLGRERSFDRSASVFEYNTLMQRMIGDYKFRNRKDFALFFSDELETGFKNHFTGEGIQALVPVPIHASRKRFRGYNQSAILCGELSKRLDIPVYGCLVRHKKTVPQKTLDAAERRKNLQDAMSFVEPEDFLSAGFKPKKVLIVDDIYTTGATAEACAEILKENGIEKVFVLSIATGNKTN